MATFVLEPILQRSTKKADYVLRCKGGLLMDVLSEVLQNFRGPGLPGGPGQRCGGYSALLGDVRTGLTRSAGLSRGGFSDKFQAWVGMGAMANLRSWRIHRGLQMLRQGQGSQEEIGLRCGYQSRTAFSRAVQSVSGTSFRELRRGQA